MSSKTAGIFTENVKLHCALTWLLILGLVVAQDQLALAHEVLDETAKQSDPLQLFFVLADFVEYSFALLQKLFGMRKFGEFAHHRKENSLEAIIFVHILQKRLFQVPQEGVVGVRVQPETHGSIVFTGCRSFV